MKIELITPELFKELQLIQWNNKALTYEAKGYDTISFEALSEVDKKALARINEILKDHICGFSSFQNFCLNKKGEINLRFQYNYGAEDNSMHFTGVGYILLSELFKGFES